MQSETITAEQIHKDFYGAEERLFVEAVGLSKGSLVNKTEKAERLKKIGFGKSKAIKDCEELNKKRAISGHLVSCIEYFRTYYPQNKFITESEVKRLCEKYGLLLGDASNFTGDMPEKNLIDIEKFKLRKEDWKEKVSFSWFDRATPLMSNEIENRTTQGLARHFSPSRQSEIYEYGLYFQKPRQSGRYAANAQLLAYYEAAMQNALGIPSYRVGIDPYKSEKDEKKEYEQPPFKICAPKEDFNTRGYEICDGYKLVYDPIVLQPVSKEGIEGYLIITAWGAESDDEIVVNPDKN